MRQTVVVLLVVGVGAAGPFDGLQAQMDLAASYFNTSFSIALRWGSDEASTYSAASGVSDHIAGTKMTTTSTIPLGSATKPFTAVAALRLADAGSVSLDAAVGPLVDKFFAASSSSESVERMYGTGAMTLRELLRMRSGVADYDDEHFREKTFANGSFDYEPLDIVAEANHTLLCDPGTCGAYSSVGYVLAGLALANASGATAWRDFDQKAAALGANAADFAHTSFPTSGTCASLGAIHQYAAWADEGKRRYGVFDIADDSCLNGWTMGNVLTTPSDLAKFWFDLFRTEDHLGLSDAALANLVHFEPLTTGWSVGLQYGFGTMLSGMRDATGNYSDFATLIGHGGEDYGSLAELNGYNPKLNFSITLAMGSAVGMNCSNSAEANFGAKGTAACYLYDQVLQMIAAAEGLDIPKLACGTRDATRARRGLAAGWPWPAEWTCVPFPGSE